MLKGLKPFLIGFLSMGLTLTPVMPAANTTYFNPVQSSLPNTSRQGFLKENSPQLAETPNYIKTFQPTSTEAFVETALSVLDSIASGKRPLTLEDQPLLSHIGKILGFTSLYFPIDEKTRDPKAETIDVLSAGALAHSPHTPELLKRLSRDLKILLNASSYHPPSRQIGAQTLRINNPALAPLLKPSYTSGNLKSLFKLLQEKGVFSVSIDPITGLARTTEALESTEMADNQWTTDSIMSGFILHNANPKMWTQNLLTIAASLNNPEALNAFTETFKNPDWYRKGIAENGVPHIFIPSSVQLDPLTGLPDAAAIQNRENWSNRKRPESQALALWAFSNILQEEALFPNNPDHQRLKSPAAMALMGKTIANLAQYLMLINREPATGVFDFAAPSASSWEEKPFEGGVTWDSAITVLAFRALYPVLFDASPQYANSPFIQAMRTEILSQPQLQQALFQPNVFQSFIQAGHQQVLNRVVLPLTTGKLPMQHPNRPLDTSLAFLTSFNYPLSEDPLENARLHLSLVKTLSAHLLRGNGMLRYQPFEVKQADGSPATLFDSYLGQNFWLSVPVRWRFNSTTLQPHPPKIEGLADVNTVSDMIARQSDYPPNREAEWSLGVTACVQGLAKLKDSLLLRCVTAERMPTPEEQQVLQALTVASENFLNRSLALITGNNENGQPILKANGYPCRPWDVMEAYEQVSTLNGGYNTVPGTHSLAWSKAQFFNAFETLIEAKALEEALYTQPSASRTSPTIATGG